VSLQLHLRSSVTLCRGHVVFGLSAALCCLLVRMCWSMLWCAGCGVEVGSLYAECCRMCIVHVSRSAGNPTLFVLQLLLLVLRSMN
jgi:hypothetical protein